MAGVAKTDTAGSLYAVWRRPQNLFPIAARLAHAAGSAPRSPCTSGLERRASVLHRRDALPAKEVLYHTTRDNKKPRFAGILEPSDGLEPSTPSLPCGPGRNRSQPTATLFACLRRFSRASGLPSIATARLHKCSILCCLRWLPNPAATRCFFFDVDSAARTSRWITGGEGLGPPCGLLPLPNRSASAASAALSPSVIAWAACDHLAARGLSAVGGRSRSGSRWLPLHATARAQGLVRGRRRARTVSDRRFAGR